MLTQSLLYLLLSILVIVFAKFVHVLVVYFDVIFTFLSVKIAPLFSYFGLGHFTTRVLLLIVIPLLLTGIPALIYYFIKKHKLPYYYEITWCVWLIIALSTVLIH